MPERRKNCRTKGPQEDSRAGRGCLWHLPLARVCIPAACAGLLLGILCVLPGCRTSEVIGKVTETPETPEPTAAETPTGTNTPSPSPASPSPSASAKPTELPTVKPVNTPTTVPTVPELPTMVPTPVPESTPTPAPTKPVTKVPVKPPTLTSGPSPTELPDYAALIQNGWQRTEDFFGKREIYFSGMFHHAELTAGPGRYEYTYTAAPEASVRFVIAGEENAGVWQFLDTLAESALDCQIFFEGEDDYRYEYTTDEKRICGRVYACLREEEENLMRVELIYPLESELYGQEGYIFYLR